MMRRTVLLALCVLCGVLPWAKLEASELDRFQGLTGELRITGSEAGLPAVRMAVQAIMEANPKVVITVVPIGTGHGVRQVKNGQASIALSDRVLDEAALSKVGLAVIPYAIDPVTVVVNPSNRVMDLGVDQAKSMFCGRIKLWSELGGSRDNVLPLYLQASEASDKPLTKPWAMTISTQPSIKWSVSHNKDIVGFVSLRDLDASLKPLPLEGVAPTLENFKAGKWQVYRTLSLVLDVAPKGLAKAFLEYMLGQDGQALLVDTGYAPLAAKPAKESLLPVGNPEALMAGL